jgi:hypothetical protein
MRVNLFKYAALAVFMLGIFNAPAQAELSSEAGDEAVNYAPLLVSQAVHVIKPIACAIDSGSGFLLGVDDQTLVQCGDNRITLSRIVRARQSAETDNATHIVVQLDVKQSKAGKAVLRVDDFPTAFVDAVSTTDLNGDGKPDFILDLGSHGNGLAAEIGGVFFLLSNSGGYQYIAMTNLMQSSPRYVRFGDSTSAVMVLQRLFSGRNQSTSVRGTDGKSHTFFSFDLLQFDAATPKGIKLANALDKRFPFLTQYTYEPTHAETALISAAKKRALWRDPLQGGVFGKLY